MWLKVLDRIGLTNLSDEDICAYYERASRLESDSTGDSEKEKIRRLSEIYRGLGERPSGGKIFCKKEIFITIFIPIVIIITLLVTMIILSEQSESGGIWTLWRSSDKFTIFLCDSNGMPLTDVLIEDPYGKFVSPDAEGKLYVDSRWVGKFIKIYHKHNHSVAFQRYVLITNDEKVITIVIPSTQNDANDVSRDYLERIKNMVKKE